MKTKKPAGGSRSLTEPKTTGESRKDGRSGHAKEVRLVDPSDFPPLWVDLGMDRNVVFPGDKQRSMVKLPPSVQTEIIRSGEVLELMEPRSKSYPTEMLEPRSCVADAQRSIDKPPAADLTGMIENGDDRVVSSKSPTKVRVSSPTGIQDSVIPRSGHSGFTRVDPGGMVVGGADGESGRRSLVSINTRSGPFGFASVEPTDMLDGGDVGNNGFRKLGSTMGTEFNATEISGMLKSCSINPALGMGEIVKRNRGEDFTELDMGKEAVGDRVGVRTAIASRKLLEGVIQDGVAPGRNLESTGHDSLVRTVSQNDQSDRGICIGIERNQPRRGLSVGNGQPNNSEQVRSPSWASREPIKNWNKLFSAPIRSNPKLDFYAPACVDGVPEIHPLDEAVFEGVSMWKGSLVGQFFDKRLPIHVVRATVDKLWGKHEMPEISTTDNGLYLFRFRDMVARDWVMENGPCI